MKGVLSVAVLAGALVLGIAVNASAAKYTVYCTNGKTEVDTRSPQQMKSARSGNTYVLATFDYRTDADKFAKKLNHQCPKKK